MGVSAPDAAYDPAVLPIRCLMLVLVAESVWKGFMLNTIGTISNSSQSLVQRLGTYDKNNESVVSETGR